MDQPLAQQTSPVNSQLVSTQPVVPPVQGSIQQSNKPPMQQPVKSHSFGHIFSIFFVLLLLLGAGAGGYYLSQPKKVANIAPNAYAPQIYTVKHMPTPSIAAPLSSTTSAIVDTSNWKTYKTNGYSVQYPNTWLVMHTDNIFADSHNAVWIFNPTTMKDEYGNGGNTGRQVPSQFVTIDQTISIQTPKQYVDSVTGKWQSTPGEVASMDVKSVTVGKLSGESYIEPGEGSRGRIIVISNGSALFLFNISVNNPSQDATIDKIVSTFSNK